MRRAVSAFAVRSGGTGSHGLIGYNPVVRDSVWFARAERSSWN
jgi:hypothetical protein